MPTFKKNTNPVMKRSGFKLKSGNSMKGSSFKMMGSSSPAKLTDVETTDPVTGEITNLGKGSGSVKKGILIEKKNQQIIEDNIMNISDEVSFNMSDDEYAKAINKGTTKVNYSKDEADMRKVHEKGIRKGVVDQEIRQDKANLLEVDDNIVTFTKKPIGPASNITRGRRRY